MQALAKLRNAPISAQKVRLVADQIRGMHVEKALDLLRFSRKKAATLVKKALDSAIANAEHNQGADIDELKVSTIMVDQGIQSKRFHARGRGRSDTILKRSCHITVMVAEA